MFHWLGDPYGNWTPHLIPMWHMSWCSYSIILGWWWVLDISQYSKVDFVGLPVDSLSSPKPWILSPNFPLESLSSIQCLAVGLYLLCSAGGWSLSESSYDRLLSGYPTQKQDSFELQIVMWSADPWFQVERSTEHQERQLEETVLPFHWYCSQNSVFFILVLGKNR